VRDCSEILFAALGYIVDSNQLAVMML